MEPDQISVAPVPSPEPDQVSVAATATPTYPVSTQVAEDRAMKASIGNPNVPLNTPAVVDQIMKGNEQTFRTGLAASVDVDSKLRSYKVLADSAKNLGRPLSFNEALLVQDMVNKKLQNPDTVIEDGYADAYMERLRKFALDNPDSDVAQAFKTTPTLTERSVEDGKSYFGKRQRIQTWIEDLEAASESQTFAGNTADFLKGWIPFYREAKMRGHTDTSVFAGGLGVNLEKQASDAFDLPGDKFNKWGNAIFEQFKKDNPELGKQYFSALLGQTAEERFMNSVFPVIDATVIGDLAKGSVSLAKSIGESMTARKAIRQLVVDLKKPSAENMSEAVGDTATSGIQRVVVDTVNKMNGADKPLDEAMKGMQSIFQANVSDIKGDVTSATARSLGQEVTNKIAEHIQRHYDAFMTAVQETMKIDRVPAVLAVETNIRKIMGSIKQDYPGLENTIMDMKFNRDTLNNMVVDVYMSRDGVSLFPTRAQAEAFIRNHWNEVGNARVVEAEGPFRQTSKTVSGKPGEPPPSFRNAKPTDEEAWQLALTDPEASLRRRTEATAEGGKVEPLTRSPQDVFVGELDNRELASMTHGKGAYDHSFERDLTHTLEIDERIPGSVETRAAETVVGQQGAGFYVVHRMPINETRAEVREAMISTNESQTPKSWLNAMGGWLGSLRTPEDTLALENILARKIATFAPSRYIQVIKDTMKDIRELAPKWYEIGTKRNQVWNDWKTVMDFSKRIPDADTGALGKVSFRSPGELGDLYMQKLNRLPSPAEVQASFAYKTQQEMLDAFNKIREYNRQTRLGAQTWEFKIGNVAQETYRGKDAGAMPYIHISANGTPLRELPGSGNVLVLGMREGEERVVSSASLGAKTQGKNIEADIASGKGTLIRLTNPEQFPMRRLSTVGDQMVDYVYVGASDSGRPLAVRRDLDWGQLSVGRIADYDYDHYVSQAIIHKDVVSGRNIYLGDRTIAAHNIRALNRDVAEKLDTIRQFLKDGNVDGAKNFHATSGLEQGFDEIHGWFKPDVSTEGLPMGPKLNLDAPITSTPSGKRTIDMGKDLNRQFADLKDYTQQRYGQVFDDRRDPFDIFTYRNDGTKASPLYKITPTKYLDPITAMNRSMSRAINGMFLDDYKVMSIEHWIQEAKNWLNVPDEGLASSPQYWFYTAGAENHWKAGTPANIKNNLMTAHMQIRQFLGIQDKMDSWLHQASQALVDAIYGGPEGWIQGAAIVAAQFLPQLRDPFQFVRSIGFHAKLGLFAVPQLLVQASTFSAIYGIAGPEAASHGTKAAMFHMWTRLNKSPEILDHLDGLASNNILPRGWLKGQWREAHDLLTRTGFENVAGEHIFQDSTAYYDFFGSKLQGFLNAGSIFFREGERQVRTAAFYTAYREVRNELTHTGPLTAAEERAVLQRADLLSINMSRASASTVNKGIFSVPMQFQSYALHMGELVFGDRLTAIEKARLFAVNGTLFGVPVAFGVSGLPLGDVIKKWSMENGYVTGSPENNYLNSAITEGLPAMMLNLMTGNNYAVGERYGQTGVPILRDLVRSDPSFLKIIGGAPFSILSNIFASVDPFSQMMLDGIRGDGKFKIKPEDFADIFREVSSANSALRLYAAVNAHRWLTRTEGYISDVTTPNAIFMTLTGLGPQELADMQNKGWTRAQEQSAQKMGMTKFSEEMRRGFQAQEQNNVGQAQDYFNRAWSWLRVTGFPEDRYSEAMSIATKDWESLINRSDYSFYQKHVPTYRQPDADKGFVKTLQQQNQGR